MISISAVESVWDEIRGINPQLAERYDRTFECDEYPEEETKSIMDELKDKHLLLYQKLMTALDGDEVCYEAR